MAHVFDHGLAGPLRRLVRNGIVASLAPLLRANGGYLLAIEPFSGTIRGRSDEDGVDRAFEVLRGRAPAVLVALGDKTYDRTGGKGFEYDAELTVQVLFLSTHARSLEERLAGDVVSTASDTADPGVEVAMEHVEQLLIGRNLAIGSKAHMLVPISEEELGTEAGLTLWAQTYRLSVSRDVKEHRQALVSITEFMTTWRGKPAPASDTTHNTQALTDLTP